VAARGVTVCQEREQGCEGISEPPLNQGRLQSLASPAKIRTHIGGLSGGFRAGSYIFYTGPYWGQLEMLLT
jgi:hypothetical protein